MAVSVKLSLFFVASVEEDLQGKTEEEIEMMKMMGFASFDTTKVSADQCSGAHSCLPHAFFGDNMLRFGTFP